MIKYLKQIKLKKLAIIGGSGFVGKSIIDAFNRGLLKKYLINEITIICRSKVNFKKSKLNLKKIKIVYTDVIKMKKLPKSDFYIYAAETTKINKYKNISQIIKKHKEAINNFCKLIKAEPNSKVLYLSSGIADQKNQIDPDSKYKEIYSSLKLFSEKKIKLLKKDKINTSIARCYTFIGRFLPMDEHYAIGNFLADAKHKRKINIKSKNLVYRSYMYADDMVDWLLTILEKTKKNNKIYNVGSDQQIELRKLASLISSFFNQKIKILSNNPKPNRVDRYVPNIKKTKNDFNLKINYNLKKAIKLTIKHITK